MHLPRTLFTAGSGVFCGYIVFTDLGAGDVNREAIPVLTKHFGHLRGGKVIGFGQVIGNNAFVILTFFNLPGARSLVSGSNRKVNGVAPIEALPFSAFVGLSYLGNRALHGHRVGDCCLR